MNSPVGNLIILTSTAGLHAIAWNRKIISDFIANPIRDPDEKTIVEAKKQLNDYFQNERKTFNLPLVLQGSPFQIQVWKQLLKIPFGTTISYGEQAKSIGDKNKARAVGAANGRNPISIVIPCHRVIGSRGHLVGFGGGIEKKAYLLNLEKKHSC
ncbi:MAG: methylated-DNA--[protein]-cysteine S-methyltransferase [Tatlockia sp.]|nr:methylated-DNA--[protein]-cysteine S-methyltransferase [Tatlockia sp.]